MPTRIVFAAPRGDEALSLRVQEEPADVEDAWRAADGLPFRLTEQGAGNRDVWVNPRAVAYWEGADATTARV